MNVEQLLNDIERSRNWVLTLSGFRVQILIFVQQTKFLTLSTGGIWMGKIQLYWVPLTPLN